MKTEEIISALKNDADDSIDQEQIDWACLDRLRGLCHEHGKSGEVARQLFKLAGELIDIHIY